MTNLLNNNRPSTREMVTLLVCLALWICVTATFVGLRPEHIALCVLISALFLLSKTTRKLVVALLPFAIFGISYDWMRIVPNYEVNPIDVKGLYEAEKHLYTQRILPHSQLQCDGFHGRSILLVLGSGSYFIRIRIILCPPAQGISSLCFGILIRQSYRLYRILHSSGGSTLVRHEVRLRGYTEHSGRCSWSRQIRCNDRLERIRRLVRTKRQCVCCGSVATLGIYGSGAVLFIPRTMRQLATHSVRHHYGWHLVYSSLHSASLYYRCNIRYCLCSAGHCFIRKGTDAYSGIRSFHAALH